jgi:hypothetical protein
MGLDRHACELLVSLRDLGVVMDRILMVGRQHLYLSRQEAEEVGVLRPFADEIEDLKNASNGFSESFLRRLGASDVESLDYSDYEGATLVHDLNQPIPGDWEAQYDMVVDGGSLEHVFQYPTALESCLKMVKSGGYFVTATPANNYSGHGFYQFSAELFFRVLARENGFSLPLVAFAEVRRGGRIYRVEDPAKLGSRVLFGGKGPMMLLVAARREEVRPLFVRSPAQSDYVRVWESSGGQEGSSKRRFSGIRRWLPSFIVRSYDHWRIEKRWEREALRGVHSVNSVRDAFDGFQSSPG